MPHRSRPAALSICCLACGCVATPPADDRSAAHHTGPEPLVLADFDADHARTDTHSGEWRVVNDNIMGGRSVGDGRIRDGAMVFSGSTNTDGGGFSSLRAADKQWDLTGYDGLAARVRADGRRYVFHVQTSLSTGNNRVFYRGSFDTENRIATTGADDQDGWQTVFVPFEDFVPMIRGRDVSARVAPLDPADVRGIGLMIDDGLDGPFTLKADWIKAVTAPDRPTPGQPSGN